MMSGDWAFVHSVLMSATTTGEQCVQAMIKLINLAEKDASLSNTDRKVVSDFVHVTTNAIEMIGPKYSKDRRNANGCKTNRIFQRALVPPSAFCALWHCVPNRVPRIWTRLKRAFRVTQRCEDDLSVWFRTQYACLIAFHAHVNYMDEELYAVMAKKAGAEQTNVDFFC